MAGYSATLLVNKLGIKAGCKLYLKNPPANYRQLIEPVPENVRIVKRLSTELDLIHFFTKSKKELTDNISQLQAAIKQNGCIWVSWPKKAAKIPTDITEDTIREVVLPLGLVDVKVCAVDEVWSGLKLVIRQINRK